MTERELTAAVLELAGLLRWRTYHARPALTRQGRWVTPIQGSGVGFPDLVLVRDRVVYAELKTNRGRLTREQNGWLVALADAGAEVHWWRERDWVSGRIEEVLR